MHPTCPQCDFSSPHIERWRSRFPPLNSIRTYDEWWNWHYVLPRQVHKTFTASASFCWDTCSWNPATRLWGSPSTKKPALDVPAEVPAEISANSEHQPVDVGVKETLDDFRPSLSWCLISKSPQLRPQTSRSRDKLCPLCWLYPFWIPDPQYPLT